MYYNPVVSKDIHDGGDSYIKHEYVKSETISFTIGKDKSLRGQLNLSWNLITAPPTFISTIQVYLGYDHYYIPFLKIKEPIRIHTDEFSEDDGIFNWNSWNLYAVISSAVLIEDVSLNTVDKLTASLGGRLVIVKGICFILTGMIVRNKWMKSLV